MGVLIGLLQQHGRVFENAQRLRELLSEDYMEKLQERVAQQRKDIQRRSDQLEQKILSMEQVMSEQMTFKHLGFYSQTWPY